MENAGGLDKYMLYHLYSGCRTLFFAYPICVSYGLPVMARGTHRHLTGIGLVHRSVFEAKAGGSALTQNKLHLCIDRRGNGEQKEEMMTRREDR